MSAKSEGRRADARDRRESDHAGIDSDRRSSTPAVSPIGSLLSLQGAAGNRAVAGLIQAKLRVGPAGGKHEQEADRIADLVTRSAPVAGIGAAAPHVQRQDEDEVEDEDEMAEDEVEDELEDEAG